MLRQREYMSYKKPVLIEQSALFEDRLIQVAKNIEKGSFEASGVDTGACRFCEYERTCSKELMREKPEEAFLNGLTEGEVEL